MDSFLNQKMPQQGFLKMPQQGFPKVMPLQGFLTRGLERLPTNENVNKQFV